MEELEIMRRQLAAMKQRLDTQQIVNAQLMRNVMRSKASWLNRLVTGELIVLPLLYLFFVWLCDGLKISQWYSFSYLVLGLVDWFFDLRTIRIPSRLFSVASILELKKFLLKQKRERMIQTCVALPAVGVWLVLLAVEMLGKTAPVGDGNTMGFTSLMAGIVGGAIGTVIGVVAVILIYRKMQRVNDELLRDIRTLEEEF